VHSATIPLAALATFAVVYWLAPTPSAAPEPESEPVAAVEARPPTAQTLRAAPVAERVPIRPLRSRSARPHRTAAARFRAAAPVRRVQATEVYFSGCNEVRAAGLAPLYRGQPGYRPQMDGDDDGIACEPYRGR